MASGYGIDFGTTNSAVAVIRDGVPETLKIDPAAPNPYVLRSVIYVSPEHKFLFGQEAIDAYLQDIAQGKSAVRKRVVTGKQIKVINAFTLKEEVVPEIIEVDEYPGGRLFQSLKSVLSNEKVTALNIFGKIYSLEEMIGMFLGEIKRRADEIVGEDVTSCVVGRPVEYVNGNNDFAVSRMKKVLELAGFRKFEFEFEPVGAALDYGINIKEKQTAMVFDFGGGTLDITIFTLPEKKVLANVGLAIGGDHFNSQIFMKKISKHFGHDSVYGEKKLSLPNYIFDSLKNWYRISLLKTNEFAESLKDFGFMNNQPETIRALESLILNNLGFALYEEIERTKKGISREDWEIYRFIGKNINIEETVSRREFEQIIYKDLEDIKATIDEALSLAKLTSRDVDFVATTGGSSLIPRVQKLLFDTFGKEKLISSDAFTSVASGLAIRAEGVFK